MVNGVVYYDILLSLPGPPSIYIYIRIYAFMLISFWSLLDPVRMPAMNGNDMLQEFASHDIGFAQKFAFTCTFSFHAGH